MTREKLIEKLKAYAPFGEFAGEPCHGALIAEALIHLLTEKAPIYKIELTEKAIDSVRNVAGTIKHLGADKP